MRSPRPAPPGAWGPAAGPGVLTGTPRSAQRPREISHSRAAGSRGAAKEEGPCENVRGVRAPVRGVTLRADATQITQGAAGPPAPGAHPARGHPASATEVGGVCGVLHWKRGHVLAEFQGVSTPGW